MLRVALALLLFAVLPAAAADWGRYANPRFGYAVAVPPGFAAYGPPAANGDGLALRNRQGTQRLAVWGGQVMENSFEAHAQAAIGRAAGDGWSISYQAVTPGWASYSGSRNGQVLYGRDIALCGGRSYASFQLTYPERDIGRMNAVVERLVGSLRAEGAGGDC